MGNRYAPKRDKVCLICGGTEADGLKFATMDYCNRDYQQLKRQNKKGHAKQEWLGGVPRNTHIWLRRR